MMPSRHRAAWKRSPPWLDHGLIRSWSSQCLRTSSRHPDYFHFFQVFNSKECVGNYPVYTWAVGRKHLLLWTVLSPLPEDAETDLSRSDNTRWTNFVVVHSDKGSRRGHVADSIFRQWDEYSILYFVALAGPRSFPPIGVFFYRPACFFFRFWWIGQSCRRF